MLLLSVRFAEILNQFTKCFWFMRSDCLTEQGTFRANSTSRCPFTKGSDDSLLWHLATGHEILYRLFLLFPSVSLSNQQPSSGNQVFLLVLIARVHRKKRYFHVPFSSSTIFSWFHQSLSVRVAASLSLHFYGKTSPFWKESGRNFFILAPEGSFFVCLFFLFPCGWYYSMLSCIFLLLGAAVVEYIEYSSILLLLETGKIVSYLLLGLCCIQVYEISRLQKAENLYRDCDRTMSLVKRKKRQLYIHIFLPHFPFRYDTCIKVPLSLCPW